MATSSVQVFVAAWLSGVWDILLESSFLFLIGLLLAGLLWYFLSARQLNRLLAGSNGSGVLRAALIGIPLPLCSCSVLPVATQVRKAGASKGAVAAFLIATPESGVDSIMLTYALTDPLLTVARPVAAFATALAAGGVEASVGQSHVDRLLAESTGSCCTSDSCATSAAPEQKRTLFGAMRYAFTDIMADLAPYLFIGFLLAGLVSALLGESLLSLPTFLLSGWGGYTGAIIAGLPMYICASASTPLAAVLLGAGFSPGMILVFLLVGPATNLSALAVVKQLLGGMATLRYLLVITIVAVFAGLLVDQLYPWLGITPRYKIQSLAHGHAWHETAAAVLLAFLMLYWTGFKLIRRLQKFSL